MKQPLIVVVAFAALLTLMTPSRLFPAVGPGHTFALGTGEFLLDGKPFQIIAGEMHFARIPREYWRHRLRMARAMGLNTIATYVFWNYQEPERGKFDFTTENRDIAEFIRIAREEGLWVILRPGPYACAEWDFGGYPWWLLKEKDLVVRSKDPRFLEASAEYLKRLGEEVGGLQITHGGPIILVQVENEYGSYGSDKDFMGIMRDQIRGAGFDVPLFTADGPSQVRNACLPGVLPAINGGDNAAAVRDTVNKYHDGAGPYFVPEYYPGWLDHWGEKHQAVPTKDFLGQYDTLLLNGVSVSLYMFHGGTNFGFTNGANYDGRYQPQPTSYDYDAPLDEAGRPTPKYYELRRVIAGRLPAGTKLPEVPKENKVIGIPPVSSSGMVNLFDAVTRITASREIQSMEDAGVDEGYIVYRTTINTAGKHELLIDGLRDYGIVFLNGARVASLDRRHKQKEATLEVPKAPARLDILVENGGRINYGRELVDNRKGITNRVTLDGTGQAEWEILTLPVKDMSALRFKTPDESRGPGYHQFRFNLADTGDTFFDMGMWGKGCVWVNGHNLGRFWYIGPQQTLYCPGVWLHKGNNEVVVLELEDRGVRTIRGLEHPILDHLNADLLAPPMPKREKGLLRLQAADLKAEGLFLPGDSEQTVRFSPMQARYVSLQSHSSLRDDPFASMSEFYVLAADGTKLDRSAWKVYSLDSEELVAEDGRGENAFDDDIETIWHTQWGSAKPPHPHYISIDLGSAQTIGGFIYRSRRGNAPGKIKAYSFYARLQPFEFETK